MGKTSHSLLCILDAGLDPSTAASQACCPCKLPTSLGLSASFPGCKMGSGEDLLVNTGCFVRMSEEAKFRLSPCWFSTWHVPHCFTLSLNCLSEGFLPHLLHLDMSPMKVGPHLLIHLSSQVSAWGQAHSRCSMKCCE